MQKSTIRYFIYLPVASRKLCLENLGYFKIYLQSFEKFMGLKKAVFPPSHGDTTLTHSSILNKPFPHFPFSEKHVLLKHFLLTFLPHPLISSDSHTSVPIDSCLYMLFSQLFFFLNNRPTNLGMSAALQLLTGAYQYSC